MRGPRAVRRLVMARKTEMYGALLRAGIILTIRLNWQSWKPAVTAPTRK
jgi:hypothetical protein